MTVLLLVVLGLDIAPRAPVCSSDADCTVVQSGGCCGSCCGGSDVVSVKEAQQRQSRCAKVDCKKPDCSAMKCAPAADLGTIVPTCEAGQCVAKHIAPPAPPPEVDCTRDTDCTMEPLPDCCGSCCPARPSAHSKKAVEERRHLCSIVDCAAPRCAGIACPDILESAADMEAICRGNRCVSVHIPKAECNRDSDCRVDENVDMLSNCSSSPCGCCPGQYPIAVPTKTPMKRRPPPPPQPRPLTKKDSVPPYGLSQGNSGNGPPPTPSCSPCPTPPPRRAICSEHQCRLSGPNMLE